MYACVRKGKKDINRFKSDIFKDSLKIFYYKPNGYSNIGDEMNPYVLKKMFNITAYYRNLQNCSFTAIGSLLQNFITYDTHKEKHEDIDRVIDVWGSGFICSKDESKGVERFICDMNFLAVRGKLSRQRVVDICGTKYENLTLGDPGLFAAKAFKKNVPKKYKFGFIPHYIDFPSEYCSQIMNALDDVLFINVSGKVEKVLADIASCEVVLSSALHGLIIADSFNIPNLWIRMSDNVIGGDYKFLDYYSALGVDEQIKVFDVREELLPKNLQSFIKEQYFVDSKKIDEVCENLEKALHEKMGVLTK